MEHNELKPWTDSRGMTWHCIKNSCIFCKHCSDVFIDYVRGPYLFACEKGGEDYKTCNQFEEENYGT